MRWQRGAHGDSRPENQRQQPCTEPTSSGKGIGRGRGDKVSSLGLRSCSWRQQVDWGRCKLLISSPNCSQPRARFSPGVDIGIKRLRRLMCCMMAKILVTIELAQPRPATSRVVRRKLVAGQRLRVEGAAPALQPFVACALVINGPRLKRRQVSCNCTGGSGTV
jgi:hypothetical protein